MRRLRLRWLLVSLGVGTAVWTAAVVVVLVGVVESAREVPDELDEIRADLSIDSMLDGTAVENMQSLRVQLRAIDRGVGSPVIAPLRLVPGVGRQIRSAGALSTAGIEATDIGMHLLDELTANLDGPLPSGADRLRFVDEIEVLLADGRAAIDDVTLGPDGPLFSELAEARTKAADGLDDLGQFIGRAEALTASVRSLLADGDQLLLAANNAEMRSGSGMFLQVGALDAVDGRFVPSGVVPTGTLGLPEGAVDARSSTYADLWGFLKPAEEWRNLAASPRFDVTAELATRMWAAAGNDRPRGAIAVDVFGLRALLDATGPVTIDGLEIGADDVVPFLLNDQYDLFADNDAPTDTQTLRRDRLSQLVDAAFTALDSGSVDPVGLLEGLRDAVRGRHILAWSEDPAVQAGWAAGGMTGELDVDSVMVSVLNRGANKLDPFLRVTADLSFDVQADVVLATLDVTIRNNTPNGEVRYVAGPATGAPTDEYGDYAGILSLSLPGVAREATIDGVPSLEVAAPDGPVLAVATKFMVAQGDERSFEVTFELPRQLESVRLEPDARPEPIRWTIGEQVWQDGEHHRVQVGD